MKQIVLDLQKENQTIEIKEDTELLGLFIGKNNDLVKTSIKLVHKKPGIHSNILIKAVLWDNSRFDFEGDLIIEKGAKSTNTYLKADILILSDKASARAVPSLEIKEDDVKAGHGATIGRVDDEQLFYLISRGLSKKNAEKIIVEGFIKELQEKLSQLDQTKHK